MKRTLQLIVPQVAESEGNARSPFGKRDGSLAERKGLRRMKGSWLLATYLILGCVGIDVRKESESPSGNGSSGGGD